MTSFKLIATLILLTTNAHARIPECNSALMLRKAGSQELPAVKLNNLIGGLAQQSLLNINMMRDWIRFLEEGNEPLETLNTVLSSRSDLDYSTIIYKFLPLQVFLEKKIVTNQEIIEILSDELEDLGKLKRGRDRAAEDVSEATWNISLRPIQGGSFDFVLDENSGTKQVITISKPLWVMDAPLTIGQWRKNGGKTDLTEESNFLPLSRVTFWSAIELANHMSEQEGLEPVYDTSKINYTGGDWRDGDLQIDMESSPDLVSSLRSAHSKNGYRLPTFFEQYWLRKLTLDSMDEQFSGNERFQIEDHAWFHENTQGEPVDVYSMPPVLIYGKPFYDVIGLVQEWTVDNISENVDEMTDPIGILENNYSTVLVGSGKSPVKFFGVSKSENFSRNSTNWTIGIRFVRTMSEEEIRIFETNEGRK